MSNNSFLSYKNNKYFSSAHRARNLIIMCYKHYFILPYWMFCNRFIGLHPTQSSSPPSFSLPNISRNVSREFIWDETIQKHEPSCQFSQLFRQWAWLWHPREELKWMLHRVSKERYFSSKDNHHHTFPFYPSSASEPEHWRSQEFTEDNHILPSS